MSSAKNHRKRSQMQKFSPIKGRGMPIPFFARAGKHRMGRSRAPKKITAEQ